MNKFKRRCLNLLQCETDSLSKRSETLDYNLGIERAWSVRLLKPTPARYNPFIDEIKFAEKIRDKLQGELGFDELVGMLIKIYDDAMLRFRSDVFDYNSSFGMGCVSEYDRRRFIRFTFALIGIMREYLMDEFLDQYRKLLDTLRAETPNSEAENVKQISIKRVLLGDFKPLDDNSLLISEFMPFLLSDKNKSVVRMQDVEHCRTMLHSIATPMAWPEIHGRHPIELQACYPYAYIYDRYMLTLDSFDQYGCDRRRAPWIK